MRKLDGEKKSERKVKLECRCAAAEILCLAFRIAHGSILLWQCVGIRIHSCLQS